MSNGTEAEALGKVIRDAMRAAGLLTEKGRASIEAERRTGINRMTLDRLLTSGDFTSTQLGRIATALGTTRSALMLEAEGVAA